MRRPTREKMTVPGLRSWIPKVIHRFGIAAKHSERLSSFGCRTELKISRTFRLINMGLLSRIEYGRHNSKTQMLDPIIRDDTIFLKPGCSMFLERKGNAQVINKLASQKKSIALCSIPIIVEVKVLPMDAQHAGNLDDVGDGSGGVRFRKVFRHTVPASLLPLHTNYEGVRWRVRSIQRLAK